MKKFLLFAIVITFSVMSKGKLEINCKKNQCKDPLTHTMCRYRNPKPAKACGTVFSDGLTDAEKKEIVKKHTDLRAYVAAGKEKRGKPGPQPPAVNMKPIEWNEDIAEIAQRWANQCEVGHDTCRKMEKYAVGQNVGEVKETGPPITPIDIIQGWYDEVKNFNRKLVSGYDTNEGKYKDVLDYTQIVWANTNKVGCGKIVYQKPRGTSKRVYLVCNYGPIGNWPNVTVYKTA